MTDTPDLTLYGVPGSGNCQKAALMLKLCGLSAAFRRIDLKAGDQHAPAFRAINPLGEVPVLVEADGRTIRQSPLILKHLAARSGKYGGAAAATDPAVEGWLYFDQQRCFLGLAQKRFLMKNMPEKATPDVMAYLTAQGERTLSELDRALTPSPWLAGEEATIADIACQAYVQLAPEAEFDLDRWPNVTAWLARIRDLPGWTAPYELMTETDGTI